jgi:NAD-dependent deacetylase
MHGEHARALCNACDTRRPWQDDLSVELACADCGAVGSMRPDVVWFGEMPYRMEEISSAIAACELFISIGTSGTVYPAAGFVAQARESGAETVELNLEPSNGHSLFTDARYGPATAVVPAFVDELLTASHLRA